MRVVGAHRGPLPMAQQNGGFWSLIRAKLLIVVLLGFGLYLIGPPLYWHFVDGARSSKHSCPACVCDCDADNFASIQLSSLSNPGVVGTDCINEDPEWQRDRDASVEDQLREQLELQRSVASENKQRADTAYLDAKKLSSQYQKEAEKCNIGMETSEEARERAEASVTLAKKRLESLNEALALEKQKSALWRKRAKEMGWSEEGGAARDPVDVKVTAMSEEEPRRSHLQVDTHDPELTVGVARTSDDVSSVSRYKKKSSRKRKSRSISS
eukprot:TRINITY_DN13128_c0_g1_i1.p1 TRINITY_DN13128_c0_g1~~TRINITY_DN13128_c0_g1_i1.p1  ORF type:complete len:269 (+),score=26.81 TRINITY_DN13128_c0_g1_i1:142-948(+)